MRSITKNSLAALAVVMLGVAWVCGGPHAAAATSKQGGVTISPATLTLSLAKGAAQQTATFTITNNYSAVIALHLSFAQPVVSPGGGTSALKQLTITPEDVSIAPGETAKPTITLTDNSALAPGSQQVELAVSQLAVNGDKVTIIPSVRMPLAVIKLDGAVTKLSASGITKPTFALNIPDKISLTINNTGNMLAIPRGYITVRDPRGREIRKGIINSTSAAVTPGSQLRVSTALAALNHAWLPGVYHVQVSYGLGGSNAAQTATAAFFYLPLWHVLLLALFGAMAYCGRQIWREVLRLKKQGKAAAKPSKTARKEAA